MLVNLLMIILLLLGAIVMRFWKNWKWSVPVALFVAGAASVEIGGSVGAVASSTVSFLMQFGPWIQSVAS